MRNNYGVLLPIDITLHNVESGTDISDLIGQDLLNSLKEDIENIKWKPLKLTGLISKIPFVRIIDINNNSYIQGYGNIYYTDDDKEFKVLIRNEPQNMTYSFTFGITGTGRVAVLYELITQ